MASRCLVYSQDHKEYEYVRSTFPSDLRLRACVGEKILFNSGKTLIIKETNEKRFFIEDLASNEVYWLEPNLYVQSVSLSETGDLAVINVRRHGPGFIGRFLLLALDQSIPLDESIVELMNYKTLEERHGNQVYIANVGDIRNFPIVDLYVFERYPVEGEEFKNKQWYKYYRTWQRWNIIEEKYIKTLDENDLRVYENPYFLQLLYEGVRRYSDFK